MNDPMLQVLADRVAITEILHAYCRALDTMELEAIGALFAEDCVVSYGPRLESRGAGQLAADLARLWRWRRTSHHLSNVTIRLDGDSEEAESYVIAWHEAPDGRTATLFGQYHDRLRRLPEGWRIAGRRQVMNGSDAGFTLAIHPLRRRPPPPGWTAPDMTAAM
jgi:3-phenylpropionate/cinnamic acid dioxygenase small subunit